MEGFPFPFAPGVLLAFDRLQTGPLILRLALCCLSSESAEYDSVAPLYAFSPGQLAPQFGSGFFCVTYITSVWLLDQCMLISINRLWASLFLLTNLTAVCNSFVFLTLKINFLCPLMLYYMMTDKNHYSHLKNQTKPECKSVRAIRSELSRGTHSSLPS